jgi:hypothetical protein
MTLHYALTPCRRGCTSFCEWPPPLPPWQHRPRSLALKANESTIIATRSRAASVRARRSVQDSTKPPAYPELPRSERCSAASSALVQLARILHHCPEDGPSPGNHIGRELLDVLVRATERADVVEERRLGCALRIPTSRSPERNSYVRYIARAPSEPHPTRGCLRCISPIRVLRRPRPWRSRSSPLPTYCRTAQGALRPARPIGADADRAYPEGPPPSISVSPHLPARNYRTPAPGGGDSGL